MIYPFSKRFFEQLAPDIVQRLQIETDRQGLDLGRMLADAAVALLGQSDVLIPQMVDEQVLALCDGMMWVDQQARRDSDRIGAKILMFPH